MPVINFDAPAPEVARALLGAELLFEGVGGRIVEVEAYERDDPASHSFGGPTARNAVMFGAPGHVYVYLIYGMYWCLNFSCGAQGHGAGVLIRALEPTTGLDAMRARRGQQDARALCSGPGKLCTALGLSRAHNGLALDAPPFSLRPPATPVALVVGPRIGISKAMELPWRFGEAGSSYLSKAF